MKIYKIINNNVISAINEQGKEVVLMGKGIGFQKKVQDEVNESLIEKIFALPKEYTSEFEKLLETIPYEHIKTAEAIIDYATATLGKPLNRNLSITLTDHLNYAVERNKQGVAVPNELLWDIRKYYHAEYQIGVKAIQIVKEQLGISLSKDEAGFIALHIVNAEMETSNMRQVSQLPAVMKEIISLVEEDFSDKIDPQGMAFERFLTHLKFFLQRVVEGVSYEEVDKELYILLQRKYPRAFGSAQKINVYMIEKMEYVIPEEEISYLTIHIARMIQQKVINK